ncbi:hypothetical protein NL526_30195, partial [Klebsiella pneumoniae]|nr:hypothetical protein [Klebsiella pneumoniae]
SVPWTPSNRQSSRKCVSVKVNGLTLKFELKSGSDNFVVKSNVWEQLGSIQPREKQTLTA